MLKVKKAPTGIEGFDEITNGGLPKNRPTILCGNSGSGKTLMSMEFLINGASKYNEPGIFISFEEKKEDLVSNMESMDYHLATLIQQKKIYIEYMSIGKTPSIEAGNFDLEGLFLRLDNAIKKMRAKRIVLDSLDALFFGLDGKILRQEIKRLFTWLKEKNVTALITAAINNDFFSKDGLEQYVADCVIALDNRVINQIATRRLRILKMRGSIHGNNEYPFTIDEQGISALPIISQLKGKAISKSRISSGILDLDGMLDGKGFYQGSSIMVSGSAGTAKTSIAMSLVYESCKQKKRSIYCAFEESAPQIIRNMNSIGLNIEPFVESGILKFYSSRPTLQNLELHLLSIKKLIQEFKPEIVVLDPVTNLMSEGINSEIRQMLTRFADFLKEQGITTLFTAAITLETIKSNPSDEGISAMMDTWILVRNIELNSELNRSIHVLKSRGMNHSTQVREFVITNKGISLLPIYISSHGILTGSSKLEQTLKREGENNLYQQKLKNNEKEMERKRRIMEEDINVIKDKFKFDQDLLNQCQIDKDSREEIKNMNEEEIKALRNQIMSSKQKLKHRNM
ncbi:MAG: circadian clock protein KaiC [Chitinophagaceae bacterium]